MIASKTLPTSRNPVLRDHGKWLCVTRTKKVNGDFMEGKTSKAHKAIRKRASNETRLAIPFLFGSFGNSISVWNQGSIYV